MADIDIKKIAQLARLDIEESKAAKFKKDFVSILDYFNMLQKAGGGDISASAAVEDANKNVYREDLKDKKGSKEKEMTREDLLSRSPDRKGNYLKVKAILK